MIFFAAASANQNDLVEREVREAGASDIHTSSGGVEFSADLETAYRFCMWTRCATRLLVLVHRYDKLESTDDLFEYSMKRLTRRRHSPSRRQSQTAAGSGTATSPP